ncbi:hypothetical protein [Acidithiobacillus thiooxidans]|uniref:EGF-like domain-containing protein n=1 Tax=Acidithiobacillus thiooxidans ATCC 19377 TaxID=637390 RepID=A0A543Q6H7_ACITH|nr:hypothetical protein [Acidithiobacillus thiooxidans]MDX5933852.1 hypothetical protein [Acidithiobacillus thiooxidans]TQN51930.1 hypothetical protein DLNHIDIE_01811 [Acidithiobacillus thiooxidans ATCC 19377]
MPSRLVIRILVASLLFGAAGQAWAFNPNYSGDTIQDDIAREFNGATSYTIPLSAPTQSVPETAPTASNCEDTLQQEMGTGEIPTTEECYCPVGATQPVCSALPESDCPSLLADEEQRLGTDLQYYDCTCPPGANSPQCTSYYNLCEAALPSYQNSTNECTCSQTATSAVPSCESDYDICESSVGNYDNSTTSCSCDQNSPDPLCCEKSPVTGSISYDGSGNPWTITGGSSWSFTDPQAASHGGEYAQTIQYDPANNTFSGSINITGTVEVGNYCGGNSGLIGSGDSIEALNSPQSSCGTDYANQTATGPAITLASAQDGGTFSGGPISVNNIYGAFTFSVDSGNPRCVDGYFNGGYLGQLCADNQCTRENG